MVVLCEQTLIRALDGFERGLSQERVARELLGVSRRYLYRWLQHSKEHHGAFFLIYRDEPGWFHEFATRARDRWVYEVDPDLEGMDDEEIYMLTGKRDRWLRDANGDRVRRQDEPEPDLHDIEDLTLLAQQRPRHPQPDGIVDVGRPTPRASDPPEQITGAPEPKSIAERERSHPRAYSVPEPQPPRPRWTQRPTTVGIDQSGYGDQSPPDAMRMTAATHTVPHAERLHHGPLTVHVKR